MKFKLPSLATMPAWIGVLVLEVILLIVMALTQPVFFSGSNLSNIIRSSAIPIVLGIMKIPRSSVPPIHKNVAQ